MRLLPVLCVAVCCDKDAKEGGGKGSGRRSGPSAEEGPLRCLVAGGVFVLYLGLDVCIIGVYVEGVLARARVE